MSLFGLFMISGAVVASIVVANEECKDVPRMPKPIEVVGKLGQLLGLVSVQLRPGLTAVAPQGKLKIRGTINAIRDEESWCGKNKPFVVGEMQLNLTGFGVEHHGVLAAAMQLHEFDKDYVVWKSPVIASRTMEGDAVFYRDHAKGRPPACFYWWGKNQWQKGWCEDKTGKFTFKLSCVAFREHCDYYADQELSQQEVDDMELRQIGIECGQGAEKRRKEDQEMLKESFRFGGDPAEDEDAENDGSVEQSEEK